MAKKSAKKTIDFTAGFTAAVEANQKVWEHDRSSTVGSSEVFSCHRQTAFKKLAPEMAELPEEADPEWGHTERGNLIENEFAVPGLREMFGAENCLFMGSEQKTFVDGHLSSTPDGLIIDQERDALEKYGVEDLGPSQQIQSEIKTFGGDHAAPKKKKVVGKDGVTVHTLYEAKPRHQGQNIVQMGIMRRKTNYSPDYGVVLYFNPVNLKDIRPAVVKYDDSVYQNAKKRAEAIFEPGKKPADFRAEGKYTGLDCQYCDFVDACSEIEINKFPDKVVDTSTLTEEAQEELASMTKKVAGLRKQHSALEKEKKLAEADLKDKMFDLGTNRAAGKGWSATVSKVNGRKSLDQDKLVEELNIDLDDYQKEGNPYFTLRTKADD